MCTLERKAAAEGETEREGRDGRLPMEGGGVRLRRRGGYGEEGNGEKQTGKDSCVAAAT